MGHLSFSADLESGVQLTFPELGKTNLLRIQEVYRIRLRDKCFSYSDARKLKFVFQMGLFCTHRGGGVRRGRRQTVRVSIIRW